MRYLFAVLLFVFSVSQVSAATYWVSKSGSDANGCFDSATEPTLATQSKLTITAGLTCLSSGDTLKIKVGTYTEAISNPISGITIEGVSGETVTLQPSGSSAVFQISAARSNITVRNLTFDCINGNTTSCRGVNTSTTAVVTGLVIESTRTTNYRNDGFVIGDSTSGATIRYNKVDTFLSADTSPSNALYFRGSNSIIEYNEFGPNIRDGLSVRSDVAAPGNIYRYNYWHDGSSSDTGSRMLNISKAAASNPTLFHNNIIDTHNRSGVRITAEADGVKFYNNTFYNLGGACFWIDAGAVGTEFINNICRTSGSIFSDAGTGTVKTTNACSSGTGCSVTADPLLVNPASGDFSVQSTSPVIDAGTSISGFSCAGNCDIGAYEASKFNSCSATGNTLSILFDNPRFPPVTNLATTGITATVDGSSRSLSGPTLVGSNQVNFTFSGAAVSATASTVGSGLAITDSASIGNISTNVQKVINWGSTSCNVTGGGGASIAQTHFRGADLPGLDGSQLWLKAEDANFTVQQGGCARVRLKIACTGGDCLPFAPVVRAQKDAGSYTAIPNEFSTDNIKYYGTSDTSADIPAHLASICTERLTNDQASNVCASFLRADVSVPNIDLTENSEAELEAAICIDRDETVGTTYQLRVYKGDGNALDSYAQTPTITVKSPGMYQTGQLGPWDLEIRLGSELKMGGIRRRVTDRSRFVYPDIPKSAVVYQVQ